MEHKLLAVTVLFSIVCVQGAEISPKITGGTHITGQIRNEYSYAVMIHAETNSIACSGVAVADTAVITAASCFDSLEGDYSTVYVMGGGSGDVTVHENYTKETRENNIAIIAMYNKMDYQQSFNLASANPEVGTECVVTGYGRTVDGQKVDMEGNYQKVKVMDCENKVAGQICAGIDNAGVHGVLCGGDAGAPLICNNELVGIAVSEDSCGVGGVDLYQDVKDFKEWIDKHKTATGSARILVLNPLALLSTLAAILKITPF